MLKSMSIRQKFIAFGGLVAVIALTIGAIGYWGINRQTRELEGVVVTSLALRNHMEGDMMHDALRADVLAALHAAAIGKTRPHLIARGAARRRPRWDLRTVLLQAAGPPGARQMGRPGSLTHSPSSRLQRWIAMPRGVERTWGAWYTTTGAEPS